MSDLPLFTADHHGYYRDGHPFFPLIQECWFPMSDWSNIVRVHLPASLRDDLRWTTQKEQAEQIITAGKSILWEIDLELASFMFTPENSAAFFSFSLAIEEFKASLFAQFQKQTFGVILYRGDFPSSKHFPFIHWESAFLDWAEDLDILKSRYDLYCAQMMSEYLHRLVSFLPDSTLPFALIDATLMRSPGQIAQLLSKGRFEHIQLALKGATCPFSGICWEEGEHGRGYLGNAFCKNEDADDANGQFLNHDVYTLGLYLPQDKLLDAPLIQEIDQLILKLNTDQIPFRMISEEKLTEQWDGIDKLIVPTQAISGQGRRKLLGFIAAGGRIETFEGTELNFFNLD